MSNLSIQDLLPLAERIAKQVGRPTPKLGEQGGETSEASIDFQYCWLEAGTVERKSLSGIVELPGYIVNYGVVVPGVHYYRDGSGEPDDYEVNEIARERNVWRAIEAALKFDFAYDLEAYAGYIAEQELMRAEKELADKEGAE